MITNHSCEICVIRVIRGGSFYSVQSTELTNAVLIITVSNHHSLQSSKPRRIGE
jgi:hypothetical protein